MTAVQINPNSPQGRATAPASSVWVSASAGTGKTKVLTDRVLALLLDGTAPERILCLTFTRAAAAEMSNRINRRLGAWAACKEIKLTEEIAEITGAAPDDDLCARARALFAEVLDVPGRMKIQTIHAFCESLLRRFPLEADIAPHFQLLDERTAAEALHAARDMVLLHARRDDDDALAAAMAEVTSWVNEDDFAKVFSELSSERGRLRRVIDEHGGLAGLSAEIYRLLGAGEGETDADIVEAACGETAFEGNRVRAACTALAEGSGADRKRGAAIAAWLGDPAGREAGFDDYVRVFLTNERRPRRTLITRAAAVAAPEADEILRREAERLVAVDARRRALTVARSSAALVHLGEALLAAYEAHKRAHALLDYDDLILHARRLLEADGGASWVLYKLDGGIDHVLIDEAQDTNPDQWAVVRALAGEFFAGEGARDTLRTVFAVGDPKQSIYSFQRADPEAFDAMRSHFEAEVEAAGRRWEAVDLDISFRSTPAVLAAVDGVFARASARDGVAGEGHDIHHLPSRVNQAGVVELWPAVEPGDDAPRTPWEVPTGDRPQAAPAARLARAIAMRIRCWIDDKEILASKNRPVRPGDIMVLVRQRAGFVDELVRALKQHDVPVAGVDRMVLTEQLAVMDLVALGRFLLLPEDDLTLATVLKGPLFGLDDDDLFDLAYGRGTATLWHEFGRRSTEKPAWGAAWGELGSLLARADFVPPCELFSDILVGRGGRRRISARLGADANDPLDEFLSLALVFERSHTPSLQGFLQWVEEGEAEIKRDLEHGIRDEVRVMTVHGAKGLQAPIVFLPDTMSVPVQGPAVLWHGDGAPLWPPRRAFEESVTSGLRADANSRRGQEYRRLLYVAMTRAEDRLYICGWQGARSAPEACWYRLAEAALAEAGERFDFDCRADFPHGWTGAGYRLATPQQAVPETEDATRRFAPSAAPPPDWAGTAAPPEDVPPRPLAPSRPDSDEPAPRSPVGADRGAKFRRGTLIHTLLQTLPEIEHDRRADAAQAYLARKVHGLTPEQQAEYAAEVLAVFDAPEFAALFGPASRAEVPLVGCINDRVISGQVDRLVVGDGSLAIVDYKTNRPPPQRAADVAVVYLRQMAAYRAVVEEIYPDYSITCALLWTDGPRLMTLPETLLAAYAP